MRTRYVETYDFKNGYWLANTVDEFTRYRAMGESEAQALANLCEELIEGWNKYVDFEASLG